ncbi:MAG TPA: NAD(P)/FAD-dependent oxidoreductase [Thermoanaerobaculia bacterium]|nr:NAD(P)/FAD-dependent oxidoreductase [Thermoanaerobaculia bacterium]
MKSARAGESPTRPRAYDAVILGGGPAGLSAALILGRCRRRVLLCDAGRPRNAASKALHGFLTRDGFRPAELLRIGRREVAKYGVALVSGEARDARRTKAGFEVVLSTGRRLSSRMLLVATGVVDRLPEVKGLRALYGRRVFHCPYCDGWEVSDRPLAVYGRGRSGMGLSLSLKTWSRDVALLSDGPARLSRKDRARLARHRISVHEKKIERLDGGAKGLDVVFADGDRLERGALFFSTGQDPCSEIPRRLGCRFTKKGAVKTDRLESTGIPGLYVAGDASKDVQLAIVAAAEGAKAAFAINRALQEQEGLSVEKRTGRRVSRP